jgi:hypothetical protein
MSGIGRLSSQYRAARGTHDVRVTVGQWAKVVANIVRGDAEASKAVFAKAQAKKDAREAVHSAIRELGQQGVRHSPDLDYLGSIINKVVARDPEAQSEKLRNQGYRIALFDAAWKTSIGKAKGIILLKTTEGNQRDGTRALRSDLQRAFESGRFAEFRTARALVRLLGQVKQCQSEMGCNGRVPASGPLVSVLVQNARSLSSASKLLAESPHIGVPLGVALLIGIDPAKKEDLESLNPFTGGRAGKIDPKLSKAEALTALSKALADHYLGKLSLSDAQKKDFGTALQAADNAKEVIRILQEAYTLSLIEYDKSNGSVAGDVGIALTKYLHPNDAAEAKARDIARKVVEDVSAELPSRLTKMKMTLQGEDGYTALLAASRKHVATVQPSDIPDEMMDKALKEEWWKAAFEGVAAPSERPATDNRQERSANVSAKQLQAALTATRALPGPLISGPELLELVGNHLEVFSGPVWQHHEARVSLLEYLGLALAINVLNVLIDKDEYTEEDTKLFLSTLKQQAFAADARMLEFSFSGGRDSAPTFDLTNPEETRSKMIQAVHDRYFSKDTNLYGAKREQYDAEYDKAKNAKSAAMQIEALTIGLTLLAEQTVVEKPRIVGMLEDLSLLHSDYKRESLVGDDD